MTFAGGLSFSNPVKLHGPGPDSHNQAKSIPVTPFAVMTERFDPVPRDLSRHIGWPSLAGWRYWRVLLHRTNDVVIETRL